MTKSGKISHDGIVKSIGEQTIEVIINNHSACSGCHAKGICGISEVKQKTITAEKPLFEVKTGDKVTVYGTLDSAAFSVVMAYVLPSVIIIAAIVILTATGSSEIVAAIGSLATTAIYFLILYVNRRRIGKKIKFSIEKYKSIDS